MAVVGLFIYPRSLSDNEKNRIIHMVNAKLPMVSLFFFLQPNVFYILYETIMKYSIEID